MPEFNRKNILILVLGAVAAFAVFTFFSATPAEAGQDPDVCADRALERAGSAVVALNLRQAKNQLSRAVRCYGVRVKRGSVDDATLAGGVVCAINELDSADRFEGGPSYAGGFIHSHDLASAECFEDAIEAVLEANEENEG